MSKAMEKESNDMALTLGEWDAEIEKLSVKEIEKIISALDTLKEWETFRKHFNWTGMFALDPSLRYIACGRHPSQKKAS